MAKISYIQIIRKCNQQCLFCSNPDNLRAMTLAKVKERIVEFKKQGTNEIIFTGGEPTLHEDLLDIIKYASDNNIKSRIITNGQLLSRDYLSDLIKAGLKHLHLSFYSYKPQIQNYLSQNDDSYKNIIIALNNLKDTNISVNINTVINKKNAEHLDKNVIFLTTKYPFINHFVFNNLDPFMNRASENSFIVPRLVDFKKSLNNALKILKLNKKTFRVERVPLCYMLDHAQYSTETRKIVKKENRIISFLDDREILNQSHDQFKWAELKECQSCSLNKICAGLYAADKYYDPGELKPQTVDPQLIINKILN